jgi:hypothetical protein
VLRIADAVVLDEPASRSVDFDLPAYWERSAQEFRQQLPRYYAMFRAAPDVMR